jgi:hypothetical protein
MWTFQHGEQQYVKLLGALLHAASNDESRPRMRIERNYLFYPVMLQMMRARGSARYGRLDMGAGERMLIRANAATTGALVKATAMLPASDLAAFGALGMAATLEASLVLDLVLLGVVGLLLNRPALGMHLVTICHFMFLMP